MRSGRTRIIAGLVAVAVVLLSAACSPEEKAAFKAVNDLRDTNHVAELHWNTAAYDKAVAWSAHMADEGRLSHSTLSAGIPSGWTALGENVAYASTIDGAIASLEASAPHRANMLNPAFTSAGVGVVLRDGKAWVTEVFVG